jgi:hypothetical protein
VCSDVFILWFSREPAEIRQKPGLIKITCWNVAPPPKLAERWRIISARRFYLYSKFLIRVMRKPIACERQLRGQSTSSARLIYRGSLSGFRGWTTELWWPNRSFNIAAYAQHCHWIHKLNKFGPLRGSSMQHLPAQENASSIHSVRHRELHSISITHVASQFFKLSLLFFRSFKERPHNNLFGNFSHLLYS